MRMFRVMCSEPTGTRVVQDRMHAKDAYDLANALSYDNAGHYFTQEYEEARHGKEAMKPHIKKHRGFWQCSSYSATVISLTPVMAYTEWDRTRNDH